MLRLQRSNLYRWERPQEYRFSKDHRILVEPACGAALSALYDPVDEIGTAQSVLAIVCGGIGVSIEKLVKWKREYAESS